MFTQNITSTKMSLFTGNHVEKNRRCCDSIRCCTIATMDYGTDPISSFIRAYVFCYRAYLVSSISLNVIFHGHVQFKNKFILKIQFQEIDMI